MINIKYVTIYFIFINTFHIHRHIKMNDILTIDRSCGGKFDISNDIQKIRNGKSYSDNELKEIIFKADYRIVWTNHILDEYKEAIIHADNKYKKLQDKYNNDKQNYINQIKELKNKIKKNKDKFNKEINNKNKDIKDYLNVITCYEYTMWSFIIIMFSYIIYKLLFFNIY